MSLNHLDKIKLVCQFILVIGLFFLAPYLFAQENIPQENLSNLGDSQVIIDSTQIESFRVNKIQDVLNQVPGVSASSSSVAIHGSYKVRVYLDGTPLNDPTSSYGAINLDHISLKSVDRVIIIKDAGGLKYGQDATGGVILIYSKSFGEGTTTGQTRIWSGNNDTYHADADVMISSGTWGLGFKGGYDRSEGYKINNDSERIRGGVKVAYNPAPEVGLTLSLESLNEESGLAGLPAFPTPYSRQRNQNLTVTLAAFYHNFENTLYYNRGMVKNNDPTRNLDQSLNVTEFGESFTYGFSPYSWGTLTVGAGFLGTMADSSDFGKKTEHVIHVFASQSLNLTNLPLSLNLGIRFNLNSGFQNSINPEFSVTYNNGRFLISYKITRGVNTPSFQERYNHSASTLPNPNLGIEKATNQSFTINYFPKENISLNTSLFFNNLEGRITYVRPPLSGVGQYQNLGKTIYRGVDFGFNIKFKTLEIKGNYTYLEARDKDIDRFLTSQSRNSFNLEFFLNPEGKFSGVIRGAYQSKIYTDRFNTNFYGGRTLYSIRAEYNLSPLVFFVDGTNIFNKEYYYIDGLLAPPRTYFLGIKYNF
ncbi:MAG: TonB-dependent receptor plug domain-containing protein [Deltaproteobacteria bacterium]|jgi:iron complex outermembrane receptor protein|nr:TonB-dependent receptor plug domain-containing protein [Deltaproteobacteria bacterium]